MANASRFDPKGVYGNDLLPRIRTKLNIISHEGEGCQRANTVRRRSSQLAADGCRADGSRGRPKAGVPGSGFWGCSGYKDGCRFRISGKISGKKLTEAAVRKLCRTGDTPVIKGFRKKDNFRNV